VSSRFEEALAGHFRQGVAHVLAEDVAMADQLHVGCIGQVEPVLRAAQHRP
jgi:hypothetical protein